MALVLEDRLEQSLELGKPNGATVGDGRLQAFPKSVDLVAHTALDCPGDLGCLRIDAVDGVGRVPAVMGLRFGLAQQIVDRVRG